MAGGINYTPGTYATNHVVTAAEFATEVTTAFTNLQGAWASWTPTLTAATTNPTLGTGSTQTGSWWRAGKTVMGQGIVIFGSSGAVAGSGVYSLLIPAAALAADVTTASSVGDGVFFDSSAGRFYNYELVLTSSTTVRLIEASGGTFISNSSPVIPAASDQFRYRFHYQAA